MRHQARLQDAINDRHDGLADAETIDHHVVLWRTNMTDREKARAWPSRTEAGWRGRYGCR
jgi:hypothetical protein